jgi:hypothetical protein
MAQFDSGVSHILLIDVGGQPLPLGLESGTDSHSAFRSQFDLTTLSSLNRHGATIALLHAVSPWTLLTRYTPRPACATLADVGTPKVIATKKFLEKIAPWATYV